MVLTQLRALGLDKVETEFPSHYGSHSTMGTQLAEAYLAGFPSHYGSHSTMPGRCPSTWILCFHPTMVLTQQQRLARPLRRTHVSIPLWFSLNSPYYKNYTGLQGAKSNLLAKIGYRPQEPVSPHFRLPLRSTALLRKSGTDHRNRSVPIFAAAVF